MFKTQKPLFVGAVFLVALAVAALFFSAFDFAGLFIVPAVAQILERTFFVELFLQAAKSALDRFAFLYANLGVHNFHPLSNTVKGFITIYLCFFKQTIFTLRNNRFHQPEVSAI